MSKFIRKEILRHPVILGAWGFVAAIAAASLAYYSLNTRPVVYAQIPVLRGSIAHVVEASGAVQAAENPDLAFEVGGRAVYLNAKVGEKIGKGAVLAALDSASLRVQLDQARADVKAQEAKLDELRTGPRVTDLEAMQTQVEEARQALANTYSGLPDSLNSAYSGAYGAVYAQTDYLLSNANLGNPVLVFTALDSQTQTDVENKRAALGGEFAQWKSELAALSSSSSDAEIYAVTLKSVGHLNSVRSYFDRLIDALENSAPSGSFPQSSIAAGFSAVGTARDVINKTIISLNGAEQTISSQNLAIQSATDQLNQLKAGSPPQEIQAEEAQLERSEAGERSIETQISKTIIAAPFSGTVSSVNIKTGDIVTPGLPVVSLAPDRAFEIQIYLTQIDAADVRAGDPVEVTLDAYGTGRKFYATVESVDQSPSSVNGFSVYKTTLVFNDQSPDIKAGMTANALITAAEADNVLIVPKSSLIRKNDKTFVLAESGSGLVETEVKVGIVGQNDAEIKSGLSDNSKIVDFGNR